MPFPVLLILLMPILLHSAADSVASDALSGASDSSDADSIAFCC